jgi:hypothetical protein
MFQNGNIFGGCVALMQKLNGSREGKRLDGLTGRDSKKSNPGVQSPDSKNGKRPRPELERGLVQILWHSGVVGDRSRSF